MSDITDAIERTARLLHFVTAFERTGVLNYCCEGQPLATIRSIGFPVSCPICQRTNPLRDGQIFNLTVDTKRRKTSA